MKRIIQILLTVGVLCMLTLPTFALTPLEQEQQRYEDGIQKIKTQYQEGELSLSEYETEMSRCYAVYDKSVHTNAAAAKECMKNYHPDTAENRASARAAFLNAMEEEPLNVYYADALGISEADLSKYPEYTFSESALPMCDSNWVAAANRGMVSADGLQQNVCAWIYIVYADGVPFARVQMSYRDNHEVYVSCVAPGIEASTAYAGLAETTGCYTTSPISDHSIEYCVIGNDEIARVERMEIETGAVDEIASSAKDCKTYYYAQNLALLKNLDAQIENSGNLGGTSGYTYRDTWKQAHFALYVKPYLLPGIGSAVLLLGAGIGIAVYRRRKKA